MVIVVMGVSGSGKSTVGRALARAIGAGFHDADDFHPPQNVRKMKSGRPLDDADREPWLAALAEAIQAWLSKPGTDVLACSALKERYRRRLGVDGDRVRLVYLEGSAELIRSRMQHREHFMSPDLLESQFEALEPPANALELDVAEPVEQLVERIRRAWQL